jgi:molybdopterin converting factor small subunit
MNVGVKVYDSLLQEFGTQKFLVDARYVEELLKKLSENREAASPLTLQDVCIFRNGINVEMVGGPDAPLNDHDWIAVFPRKQRSTQSDVEALDEIEDYE